MGIVMEYVDGEETATPQKHAKVEKSFLLFGFSISRVIHKWLFEIIGKNQGVQS